MHQTLFLPMPCRGMKHVEITSHEQGFKTRFAEWAGTCLRLWFLECMMLDNASLLLSFTGSIAAFHVNQVGLCLCMLK